MSAKFMNRVCFCFLISLFLFPLLGPAQEQEDETTREESPDSLLTLGVLGTKDYEEGIGDVVVPIYFSGEGLWLLDARASATDRSEQEYNIGAGYRQLIQDRRSLLGANLFFDHREARSGVSFDQIGVGAEYLSHGIDARVNAYWPLDDKKLADEFETMEEAVSSSTSRSMVTEWDDPYARENSVLQPYDQYYITRTRTTTTTTTRRFKQYEVAMPGLDAEIGMRLPIEEKQDFLRLKTFAGYYHYDGRHGLDDVNGFRGRLEAQLRPAVTVDATFYSDDDLTGGHFTLGAYFSVPFDMSELAMGRNPFSGASERWDAGRQPADMSYRLVDMILRDPQVRTGLPEPEEQKDLATSVASTQTSTSFSDTESGEVLVLDDVTFVDGDNPSGAQDGTAENPYDTIQQGVDEANSPVWVFNADNPYSENVTVWEGVQLYGDGTPLNGGKTMGDGTHPVIIGPNAGPVLTLAGDNTGISGFDIRHSGAGAPGAINKSTTIWGGYQYDITHAGVYGHDVSDLFVSHNLMTDGSLGSGIVLLSDGSQPGGNINLVADFLNNDIRNTANHGLVVNAQGGSGMFDVSVSGNYSGSGGDGLRLWSSGHDTAWGEVFDVMANDNAQDGVSAWLYADQTAQLDVWDTQASRNFGEYGLLAGSEVEGAGGGAALTMLDNIQADDNDSCGVYGYAGAYQPDSGDAVVMAKNIVADGNEYGMDIYAFAYGENADALIMLQNAQANNNDDDGIQSIYSDSSDGGARVDLDGVSVNGNGEEGIDYIYAYAYGENDDAVISLQNVTADNNYYDGIEDIQAYADGDGGDAIVQLENVTASENFDAGIDMIEAYAYGMGGNAWVSLQNVTVDNNEDAGIEDVNAYADAGGARVDLVDFSANNNGDEGVEDIYVHAYGDNSDASILLQNVTANYNNYDGIEDIHAYAYGENGNALIGLSGVEASYNYDYGIDDIQAEANGVNGHALVEVNNVNLVGNDDDGIDDVEAEAYGDNGNAEIRLTDIVASHNDNDGIGRARAQTYGDNGHASVSMNNIVVDNNFDGGIDYIYANAYGMGGKALISLDNVTANNNDDEGIYYIHAIADYGWSQIALNNVTANGNRDEGIDDIYAYAGGDNSDASILLQNVTANNNEYDGIEDIHAYADGANGNALVTLNSVTANGNFDDGISFVNATADDGAATVNLADIIARFNEEYGLYRVYANAGGAGADAVINFSDSDLTDNSDGGYDTLSATAASGNAEINENNVDY